MCSEPFVSSAKAPPAKRSEKGYGDENEKVPITAYEFLLVTELNIQC